MFRIYPNGLRISSFVPWLRFACLILVVEFSAAFRPALASADRENAEAQPATESTAAKDAETHEFEAELRQFERRGKSGLGQYELRENVIASFVYAFQISSPEQRAELWQQLENDKAEAIEQKRQQEADALEMQSQPPGEYDAETLRYKAAVEKLNLPADLVADLVEMFQANDAPFRNTLWERVKASPLDQN
jgi:hypothetical protein